MFTLKFYKYAKESIGERIVIRQAENITILRDTDGAEITMHTSSGDQRLDVGFHNTVRPECFPDCFDRLIVENAAGKTSEIVSFLPSPAAMLAA